MKSSEFVHRCLDVATRYKTLYVMGCFGAPLNAKNKKRYTTNNSYNKQSERTKMILNADENTFGFDCVCFVKGILWGWCGDNSKTYGGAVYQSNGVPDTTIDNIKTTCTVVSSDFGNIVPGELVFLPGHIGVYVGEGLVVESTPKWKNGVQITALSGYRSTGYYNERRWDSHGKSVYIDYSDQVSIESELSILVGEADKLCASIRNIYNKVKEGKL